MTQIGRLLHKQRADGVRDAVLDRHTSIPTKGCREGKPLCVKKINPHCQSIEAMQRTRNGYAYDRDSLRVRSGGLARALLERLNSNP